jgi:hypothetical protein
MGITKLFDDRRGIGLPAARSAPRVGTAGFPEPLCRGTIGSKLRPAGGFRPILSRDQATAVPRRQIYLRNVTGILAATALAILFFARATEPRAAEGTSSPNVKAKTGGVSARAPKIWWEDDECYHNISFDPAKYVDKSLRDAVRLIFGYPTLVEPETQRVFQPADLDKLDPKKFESECAGALEVLNDLKPFPLRGMNELLQLKIDERRDSCAFEKTMSLGFRNPSALRDYAPAAAACSQLVDAVEGKTNLPTVFMDELERSCRDNGAPAQCVQREIAHSRLPDGIEWMRIYLIGHRWNNCANAFTRRANGKSLERIRAQVEKEFRREFKIASECQATDGEGFRAALMEIDTSAGKLDREGEINSFMLACGSELTQEGPVRWTEALLASFNYAYVRTGKTIRAELRIDGRVIPLVLKASAAIASSRIDPEVVRQLLRAHDASIALKEPEFSPREAPLKLDGLRSMVRQNMKECFKF